MKICAGLGRIDDFEAYARAGADEVFAGFVPWEWLERFGPSAPLNRREVLLHPAQIGAWDDMAILARLSDRWGVPVAVAMNSACCPPAAYPLIRDMAVRLRDMGFSRLIVADVGLLLHLRDVEGLRIHISGEFGEMNPDALNMAREMGAKRIIFHRKVTFSEMERAVKAHPDMEWEAFALNERCHYTGAMCACLHGDCFLPLCRAEWTLGGIQDAIPWPSPEPAPETSGDELGDTGCGLCAMKRLMDCGVTHLKVVGRGNRPERMERDIRAMRQAIHILNTDPTGYPENMKKELFPHGCSGRCYYPGCR